MPDATAELLANGAALPDEVVVERILAGELALYEILMRRYNQRLYRISRSIVRDEQEAEDVVQDAYVRAYAALGQFAGRARFATWLTKIAVHEALARRRKTLRQSPLEVVEMSDADVSRTPERAAAGRELKALLEAAIDELPEAQRTIFVLRDVEELSTAEAAESLGISPEAAKVRLHRARAALRHALETRFGETARGVFGFDGARCDRIVHAVLARLGGPRSVPEGPRGARAPGSPGAS